MHSPTPPSYQPSRESTPSPTEPSLRTPPLSPREIHVPLTPTPRQNKRALPTFGADSELIGMGIGTSTSGSAPMQSQASGSSIRRGSIRRGNGDAPASPGAVGGASRRVSCREDEGLVMRDKDEGSIGRAGGVDVGVTRPKRRLSR